MIARLMSYFKGYVLISAKGDFLERFLNLCLKNDILLWDLNRASEGELSAKVSISAFKSLRGAARKTRTKISLKKRYGFPFFIQKNRARRGIIPGGIVFFIIIWYFSTHLMGITIDKTTVSEKEILSYLKGYGVEIGVPLDNINQKRLKNQLMTSIEDFGWVGVRLNGSRLYIEAKDRTKPKDSVSSDTPCNIVAAKDGVIRLMEIRDGQTTVLVNTPVRKGDLLVSGVIDSNAVGMRYAHSHGEVFADTWYEKEIEIPLKYTQKVMTDKTKSKYTLKFLNASIKLYFSDNPPYKSFFLSEGEKEYALPLKIFPSVFVSKKEYFEQRSKTKSRTVDEAVELGKFYLLHSVNQELAKGATIQEISVTHEETGDKVLVRLSVMARENIARKSPIDKIEDMDYNGNVKSEK